MRPATWRCSTINGRGMKTGRKIWHERGPIVCPIASGPWEFDHNPSWDVWVVIPDGSGGDARTNKGFDLGAG